MWFIYFVITHVIVSALTQDVCLIEFCVWWCRGNFVVFSLVIGHFCYFCFCSLHSDGTNSSYLLHSAFVELYIHSMNVILYTSKTVIRCWSEFWLCSSVVYVNVWSFCWLVFHGVLLLFSVLLFCCCSEFVVIMTLLFVVGHLCFRNIKSVTPNQTLNPTAELWCKNLSRIMLGVKPRF